jgi:hypothetical protein
MTFKKAFLLIAVVLFFHALGLIFHLYDLWLWYDVPLHLGGGFAMSALGLAIWQEGISDVRFKGLLSRHLDFWLVPLFVIGFVALISVLWEMHEFLLDVFYATVIRQPGVQDTMSDFFNDLAGGLIGLVLFYRK